MRLRNHDTTKNLSPEFGGSNRLLQGHVMAKAKGPLLVGLGHGDEPAEHVRRARVWQGCVSFIERPFYFVLKSDDRSARLACDIADRLNFMFQDDPQRLRRLEKQRQLHLAGEVTGQLNAKFDAPGQHGDMAKPVSKGEVIHVRVPYGYRFNPERYLLVARNVPLRQDPEPMSRYRKRLQKIILDPASTIRAAIRLEALGKESIPTLKQGVAHEHPLVRFACAEAAALPRQHARRRRAGDARPPAAGARVELPDRAGQPR